MDTEIRSELISILGLYNLGDLVWYERDERGTVNTSFAIETVKDGQRKRYFFRKYKKGVGVQELLFEHSIINYLKSHGFKIVAGVLPTRNGETFILRKSVDQPNGVYYAIFDFLPGEDSYAWVAPRCTASEIASSADVLATFHRILYGFTPQGARAEPVIMELLPVIDVRISECHAVSRGNVFEDYFRKHAPLFRKNLKETLRKLQSNLTDECVRTVIHCDFHPGNLKYQNGLAAGLFDLDWSKLDYRLFDVSLALYYFFACWEAGLDGELRLPDAELFLKAYQESLTGSEGLKPLNKIEISLLPHMIAAANLYVLNWTMLDYLHKEVDPQEYLGFLQHHVNSIEWLENKTNRQALHNLAERTLAA